MSTTNCRIRCISLSSKRPELDLCRPLTVRARGTLSIDRVTLASQWISFRSGATKASPTAASRCLCTYCQTAVRASSDRNGGRIKAFSEYAPVYGACSETCGPSAPPESWGRLLPAVAEFTFRIIPVAMTDATADRFRCAHRTIRKGSRSYQVRSWPHEQSRSRHRPASRGGRSARPRRVHRARPTRSGANSRAATDHTQQRRRRSCLGPDEKAPDHSLGGMTTVRASPIGTASGVKAF